MTTLLPILLALGMHPAQTSYTAQACMTVGQTNCVDVACYGRNVVQGCPNYVAPEKAAAPDPMLQDDYAPIAHPKPKRKAKPVVPVVPPSEPCSRGSYYDAATGTIWECVGNDLRDIYLDKTSEGDSKQIDLMLAQLAQLKEDAHKAKRWFWGGLLLLLANALAGAIVDRRIRADIINAILGGKP